MCRGFRLPSLRRLLQIPINTMVKGVSFCWKHFIRTVLWILSNALGWSFNSIKSAIRDFYKFIEFIGVVLLRKILEEKIIRTHYLSSYYCLLVTHRRFELRTIALKVRCSTGWASESFGRGSWIWTNECQNQNLVPYRLAIPLQRSLSYHQNKVFATNILHFFAECK